MRIKTFVVTLVILLALAATACGRSTVMIDDLGLITGPAGAAYGRLTTLAQIVAAVGANSTTVIVNREITANTQNVPVSVQLQFTNAGAINVAAGQTVTFASDTSQIIAGGDTADIFVGLGAVIFAFGGTVHPDWWEYNVSGVTAMSIAVQAAIDSINVPNGGDVIYSGATYMVTDLRTYSNIAHHGVYGATTLRRAINAGTTYVMSVNPGTGGTANPNDNEMNILIEDIIFDGNSSTFGFSEQEHSLNLHAVSDLTVQRCGFIGPQGDGIYLGSSNVALTERHNERIKFLNNYFDGWDGAAHGGRNAITIIDGVDIEIRGNYITRTARVGMPGGIDVEPNANAFARVQNITIEKNTFATNSRALIQIVLLNADTYTLHPSGFKIINNYFEDTNIGNFVTIYVRFYNPGAPYLVTATDETNGVVIENNYIDGRAGSTIEITGTKGTIIRGNTFFELGAVVLSDYESITGENNYDITVDNNIFDQGGNVTAQLFMANNDDVHITNNTFRDPHNGGAGQIAIHFVGVGVTTTSSGVIISGNTFAGTMIEAIAVTSHTLTPETNRFFGNTVVAGATNEFLYDSPDDNMAWGDYDFDVDGGTFNAEYTLGQLPDNARITRAWYQMIDAFTSLGAATVRIGVQADDNAGIQANLAFDNAAYAAGYHDGLPVSTVATFTAQSTATRNVILTILIADLTAGHCRVWWEYIVGE